MAGSEVDSLSHRIHELELALAWLTDHPKVDTITVRDTVCCWVSQTVQPTDGIGTKELVGWFVTLFGITVATIVTRQGWAESAKTAKEGWAAGAKSAVDAQEHRKAIEDQRRREQLILRIRSALETTAATARSSLKKDPTHPINPETMNGIIVEWGRYDRVSDDLRLLEDPTLEDRIDTILGFARMCAEKISEDERRFRETVHKLGQPTLSGLEIDPMIIAAQHRKRAELHGLLRTLEASAQPLLDEFNRRWPAQAGHAGREVPEGSSADDMPLIGKIIT